MNYKDYKKYRKKLMPCPFCGTPTPDIVEYGSTGLMVRCIFCSFVNLIDVEGNLEQLLLKWNSRKPPHSVVKRMINVDIQVNDYTECLDIVNEYLSKGYKITKQIGFGSKNFYATVSKIDKE